MCRRRILIALESQDATKSESLKKLMGCSIQAFRKNLENQFYPNPKTGAKLMTQPKYAVHFKVGKEMRDRVNASRHMPIKEIKDIPEASEET